MKRTMITRSRWSKSRIRTCRTSSNRPTNRTTNKDRWTHSTNTSTRTWCWWVLAWSNPTWARNPRTRSPRHRTGPRSSRRPSCWRRISTASTSRNPSRARPRYPPATRPSRPFYNPTSSTANCNTSWPPWARPNPWPRSRSPKCTSWWNGSRS